MLPTLQFITSTNCSLSIFQQAQHFFDAGGLWLQIRDKSKTTRQLIELAHKIIHLADAYSAKVTINDFAPIALETNAFGVHVGWKDLSVKDVKQLLNPNQIIGLTINSTAQIDAINNSSVRPDYFGMGPYAFTTTKKNLSEILGLKGINRNLEHMKQNKLNIPVLAVGGIVMSDLEHLRSLGVYGIAISSLFVNSSQKKAVVEQIHRIFEQ